MINGIEIIGVRLWERRIGQPTNRYVVYYKRNGEMWRGMVNANDELNAWSAFAKLLANGDDPLALRMVQPLSREEQEYVSEYGQS